MTSTLTKSTNAAQNIYLSYLM